MKYKLIFRVLALFLGMYKSQLIKDKISILHPSSYKHFTDARRSLDSFIKYVKNDMIILDYIFLLPRKAILHNSNICKSDNNSTINFSIICLDERIVLNFTSRASDIVKHKFNKHDNHGLGYRFQMALKLFGACKYIINNN